MTDISFCIPTLRRPALLAECLSSIVAQADETIEIVVVCGESDPETWAVVENMWQEHANIQIYESRNKSGVAQDILQAVELAHGTYCWLFSDDDHLAPGALERARSVLRSGHDIGGITFNYQAYNAFMEYPIATVPAARIQAECAGMRLLNAETCFKSLGMHLGFISCQLIRRSSWMGAVREKETEKSGSEWIIVFMIGKILQQGEAWWYDCFKAVNYRSGNDSFVQRLGVLRRQKLTHISYSATIEALFGKDSSTYRDVLHGLVNDRMPRSLAVLKAHGLTGQDQRFLLRMYIKLYKSYPAFWVKVFPIFLFPNFFWRGVEKLYHLLKSRGVTA